LKAPPYLLQVKWISPFVETLQFLYETFLFQIFCFRDISPVWDFFFVILYIHKPSVTEIQSKMFIIYPVYKYTHTHTHTK